MKPFDWLPTPGAKIKLPGGAMWCQNWEIIIRRGDFYEGKIVLEFICSKEAYEEYEKQRPPLLTNGPEGPTLTIE